jgi:hypothetical protein
MMTFKDDAVATFKFAIRDALVANWPVHDVEKAVDAVFESLTRRDVLWALAEVLDDGRKE